MRLKNLFRRTHVADFQRLHALVASPEFDLPIAQWHRLYELAVAQRPDLIIELGRGYGNSTVVLTEAANRVGARLVSIGNDVPPTWETVTRPKLEPVLGARWFDRLTTVQGQIQEQDFSPWLDGAERVVLFWDA